MRGLIRLPEPQILTNKKNEWKTNFLASGKDRPDSSKYAHIQIKTQLNSISHTKCFYCETKLKDKTKEVDHHIEVSVDKTLAFEWTNLYLSCDSCNNKISHSTIPVNDVLDPFRNTDLEIREHLTFNDEFIEPQNNSHIGLNTIKKYRLDSEVLDTRRLKSLKNFFKVICAIKSAQNREGRNTLNEAESNTINRFKRIDNSYSLMYEAIIEKCDL
ncbi:HNH endonuclease [Elizabethkingia ursingii]|uniref:HNH domain-containing protein n=1 Tax=Elizabethkingia ursingii TaxID=1756150 RepID=A0AAJ3NBB4_9FLAO|nr:HNH endonuclease [Elizabethkingia ursingii]AQX09302.1 hypothetical protein BBD34_11890 [Elizabethkingia ursingii]OPB74330.1 hypothetical protein BAY32_08300 [Elizabethkingia ursingii]